MTFTKESKMKKLILAVMTSMAIAGFMSPAYAAGDGSMSFDEIFRMADKNNNQMVTKQEFLDAMGRAYDMKMAKMKDKKDATMMKGNAMTRAGLRSLIQDIHHGA
jgi:hypothetical protein